MIMLGMIPVALPWRMVNQNKNNVAYEITTHKPQPKAHHRIYAKKITINHQKLCFLVGKNQVIPIFLRIINNGIIQSNVTQITGTIISLSMLTNKLAPIRHQKMLKIENGTTYFRWINSVFRYCGNAQNPYPTCHTLFANTAISNGIHNIISHVIITRPAPPAIPRTNHAIAHIHIARRYHRCPNNSINSFIVSLRI